MIAASIFFTIISYINLYINIKGYIRHLNNPDENYILSAGNNPPQAVLVAVVCTLLTLWLILQD